VIVLLSHNGLDVDVKLASRVSGIDVILGGHTHDAMPRPLMVKNAGGETWVTNAGSYGKFLAVVDMDIAKGRLRDLHYRLLPVFSNLLSPDSDMQTLINTIRAPYIPRLQQPLALADRLLYRRDTFQGTFDHLILDALLAINDAQIALSPGFRWGTSLLPGHTIRYEDVMNLTATTYSETYVRSISGEALKNNLEDVADNLFNPDPYYRQGGDMVRTGGMHFSCNPHAAFGQRMSQLRLANGQPVAANKYYKVSGWASVGRIETGMPIDEVVVQYLKVRSSS
jgi:sulfur-oxidizing protein SoxB